MNKLLKLIKPLKIYNQIFLPVGTIMDENTWCEFIGRLGGIDPYNTSDSEWWQEVTIDNTLRDELNVHLEMMHNYIRGCYSDEKDELQRKEDLHLMYMAEHLKNRLFKYYKP